MKKSKIQISPKLINTIVESGVISEKEKLNFLKYVGYLTYDEQKELASLVQSS